MSNITLAYNKIVSVHFLKVSDFGRNAILFVFLWVFQSHIYRVPRDDEVINVELVQKQSNIEKKLQESITTPLIISMTQIKF